MAVTLRVRWLGAAYEAASSRDHSEAEWPPEVVRPFCGMVAVAESDLEWDALRWLEQQPPPLVCCPVNVVRSAGRRSYVVTQGLDQKDTHTTYPVRTSAPRRWPRTFPALPEASFHWPNAEAPPDVATTLAGLASRVAYVGRATSPALVDISISQPPVDRDGFETLHPAEDGDRGSAILLRRLYPGYVDILRELYARDQAPGLAERVTAYLRSPHAPSPEPETVGPYGDLLTFRFREGASRDGTHVVALAAAFRGALVSREANLPSVHGHHDGTVRQVAFLGLPFVGGDHGDGRLLGMGLALPTDLPPEERRTIIRAVVGDPSVDEDAAISRPPELWAGPVGRLQLELVDDTERRYTLQASRWTGRAKLWTTATPIVLDRFPHRGDDVAMMIAESCVRGGLPRPSALEVLRQSAVAGGIELRPSQAVRRRGETRRLPVRHAVLSFEKPVRGPVVIGHMRHYGLGLCVPFDREPQTAHNARP